MIKTATPLAFDVKGRALHKNDPCKIVSSNESVTVLDIIPQNWVVVILSTGDTKSMASTEVVLVDESKEDAPHFEQESISKQQDGNGQERVKLLTPDDLYIEGTANALLSTMKKVSKVVRVMAYKVNKVERQTQAEDGIVMKGAVYCQVQTKDNLGSRRGTISLKLDIEDGKVKEPKEFEGSGKIYPFTEASFKQWLNLPEMPYSSKKPSPVIRSNRDMY